MTSPAVPAGGAAGARPPILAVAIAAIAAGLVAVWQPIVGLGLVVAVLIAVLLRDIPMRRMAPTAVVLATLAAIGGPNLAPPASARCSSSGSSSC